MQTQFDRVYSFNGNGLAVVKTGLYYGLINTKGEEVLKPKFREIKLIGDNGYAVMFNDLWGVVNCQGKVVFEPQFVDIDTIVSDGLIRVYMMDKIGFINLNGEVVYEPQFEDVSEYIDGLAWVQYKSRKTPLKKKTTKGKKDE